MSNLILRANWPAVKELLRERTPFLYDIRRYPFRLHMIIRGRAQINGVLELVPRCFPVLRVHRQGRIILGTKVRLSGDTSRTVIRIGEGGVLRLGNECGINEGSKLFVSPHSSITFEDHARAGWGTTIVTSNSHQVCPGDPINSKPVVLRWNSWIGFEVKLLRSVEIGRHSVVRAGSVVNHDIPPKQVWGGNPAVFVRNIACDDDWIRDRNREDADNEVPSAPP